MSEGFTYTAARHKLQAPLNCGLTVLLVCRARRLTDGKVVVVKEIKTTNLSAKQKAATMDEVQVLANFNHPNIVK